MGPLAGIEAALRVAGSPLLFVFGGDMPWLSEELIRAQVNEYIANPSDILIARSGGFAEPLHSLYSRKIHTALVSHIEGAAAIPSLISANLPKHAIMTSPDPGDA